MPNPPTTQCKAAKSVAGMSGWITARSDLVEVEDLGAAEAAEAAVVDLGAAVALGGEVVETVDEVETVDVDVAEEDHQGDVGV